jgi:8-oxo-dGTP pyrophosphatase MutT (NUDIX family)
VYAVHGHVAGAYRKRHLGKDEKGFAQGTVSAIFQFGSLRFGIAICAEGEVDYPFDEPARDGAALVMFCAAPGLHRRRTDDESWRAGLAWWESEGLEHARRHALRTGEWVLLATQAGSTVDEDFPGLSAAVSPDGTVVARLPDWRSGLLTVDIPVGFEVEPVRHAARVLVFDEEGRVLLVQFSDVRGHSWWAAPGGGLDEGEDHRGAAARELGEELGRDDIELGPQIGWRSHTLSFNGQPWMTQRENWFMATHAHFEISSEQKELLQVEHVTDIAWWSAGELLSEGVVTAPRHLAETVAQIAAGNAPPPEQDLGV